MQRLLLVSFMACQISTPFFGKEDLKTNCLCSIFGSRSITLQDSKEILINGMNLCFEQFLDSTRTVGTVIYHNEKKIENILAIFHNNTINETITDKLLVNSILSDENVVNKISHETNKRPLAEIPFSQSYSYPTFDSSKFFPVDVGQHLTSEHNHYIAYSRIIDVPNYMNTQFNNNGCSPTAMAMYLSYIHRSCPEANSLVELTNNDYLPLKHTDNMALVNSFIHYLGVHYLHTDNEGTFPINIRSGNNAYLYDHGYHLYSVERQGPEYYDTFQKVINKTANPVQIDLLGHSETAIGYRRIYANQNIKDLVIVHPVSNDMMLEIEIESSLIKHYYAIRRI